MFIEKLHRAAQKHMHVNSLIGVGAMGRFLRNLEDDAIEGDSIVLGHRTLFFKAQGLFDRLYAGFLQAGWA